MNQEEYRQYRLARLDKRINELNVRLARVQAQRARIMNNANAVDIPISELGISLKAQTALKKCGIETIFDVLDIADNCGFEMAGAIPGIGSKATDEILRALEAKGYDVSAFD